MINNTLQKITSSIMPRRSNNFKYLDSISTNSISNASKHRTQTYSGDVFYYYTYSVNLENGSTFQFQIRNSKNSLEVKQLIYKERQKLVINIEPQKTTSLADFISRISI